MVRLKVMYFASARDVTGKKLEQIEIEGHPTIRDLARRIQEVHPGLADVVGSTRYAVNLEIADGDETLHDGDEIGVLPAVTGG